jgi:hypothetical protein
MAIEITSSLKRDSIVILNKARKMQRKISIRIRFAALDWRGGCNTARA